MYIIGKYPYFDILVQINQQVFPSEEIKNSIRIEDNDISIINERIKSLLHKECSCINDLL